MAKKAKRRKVAASAATAPEAWWTRGWFLGLMLVVLVLLVYTPMWQADYIWDDDRMVTANFLLQDFEGLVKIWTTPAADICPLTLSTFWCEHHLWGNAALPYHLVNVLQHGLSALLLWRILRQLRVTGAWLGAALWAVHPVEVESVAWVTELKNTQSCLFFLLAIFFFLRGSLRRFDENDLLVFFFAVLSMASKSSTVILPVVLVLCAWWREGRWSWAAVGKACPIVFVSLAAASASVFTQDFDGANDPPWGRTWPERLVTAGNAVWFYLGKIVWPHLLMMVYPRWEIDTYDPASYLPLLAVIVLSVVLLALVGWRQAWARPWFFVWAYFLVALAPVLGLVSMTFSRHSFVADHFQYLASMGPLVLIGAGLARWAEIGLRPRTVLAPVLAAGLLVLVGSVSWLRACVYQTDKALWIDNLAKNPDTWAGQNELGTILLKENRLDEAGVMFRRAAALNPVYAEAYNNLGIVYGRKNQLDPAIVLFRHALDLWPAYADARNNLGVALGRQGHYQAALDQFGIALHFRPGSPEVMANIRKIQAQAAAAAAAPSSSVPAGR